MPITSRESHAGIILEGIVKRTALTTLLTLIASGPHLHAQTPKEVRGAIDGGNAQYIAAFANADPRALAGVYDRNGART